MGSGMRSIPFLVTVKRVGLLRFYKIILLPKLTVHGLENEFLVLKRERSPTVRMPPILYLFVIGTLCFASRAPLVTMEAMTPLQLPFP